MRDRGQRTENGGTGFAFGGAGFLELGNRKKMPGPEDVSEQESCCQGALPSPAERNSLRTALLPPPEVHIKYRVTDGT